MADTWPVAYHIRILGCCCGDVKVKFFSYQCDKCKGWFKYKDTHFVLLCGSKEKSYERICKYCHAKRLILNQKEINELAITKEGATYMVLNDIRYLMYEFNISFNELIDFCKANDYFKELENKALR